LAAVADSEDTESTGRAGGDEAESARQEAIRRILITIGATLPAGGAGFLVLFLGARDTPTTGAAALLLVFAFGFPPATFALTLAPALSVWPRDRARRIAWLSALASLPMAMAGALLMLLAVSVLDVLV
jgi:hypothetical protein